MNKIALLVTLLFGVHQSQAQLFQKKNKNYEPVFEIPGRVASPSGIAIHEKYVGKIVFSDQPLTKENTTENVFKSSFEIGSPIYARVFAANSVNNYMLYKTALGQTKAGETSNSAGQYAIRYSIDEKPLVGFARTNGSENGRYNVSTWTENVFVLNKECDWGSKARRDSLNKLTPGTHKVKVVVWAGELHSRDASSDIHSIKPVAEGEFDLVIPEGGKFKVGKKWSDIADGQANPKIKADLTKLFSEVLKENYSQYTIKSYKLLQDDFGVQRDDFDLIKYRYMTIAAQATDKSGKCYYLSAMYTQDYMGGGTYSSMFKQWGSGAQVRDLDCE